MKFFGKDAISARNCLHEVISSDSYKESLGAYLEEAQQAAIRKTMDCEDDKELWRAVGAARELQAIKDWIATVYTMADRDLKKKLGKEDHDTRRFPNYSSTSGE